MQKNLQKYKLFYCQQMFIEPPVCALSSVSSKGAVLGNVQCMHRYEVSSYSGVEITLWL